MLLKNLVFSIWIYSALFLNKVILKIFSVHTVIIVSWIINNFTIEAGVKDFNGSQDSENFAFLTYRIPLSGDAQNINEKPFFSDNMFESTSVKIRLLEEVRRSNEIVYESDFSTKAGGI